MQDRPNHKQQLNTVGRLASALAHEIRNPLTAIDMHVSLLAETLVDTELSEQQRIIRFLSIIRAEIRRLNEILDHYSGFTGAREPLLEDLDITREIEELRELMGPQARAAGLVFETELEEDLGIVQADRVQLRQALLNLVINAFQATDEGGQVRIGVRRLPETRRLSLEVRDTGIGILPENLPRIFELFFTTKPLGAGLGLSIVHKIVAEHGGTIEVRSEKGEGSTFTIELPA